MYTNFTLVWIYEINFHECNKLDRNIGSAIILYFDTDMMHFQIIDLLYMKQCIQKILNIIISTMTFAEIGQLYKA